MSKTHAQRRHEAERTKARVLRYLTDSHSSFIPEADRPEYLSKRVTHEWQHRQSCSCPMCGNPRRHSKGKGRLTLQELRARGERDSNEDPS